VPKIDKSVEALEHSAGPFQRLIELACVLFDVPSAVMSLFYGDEVILKSAKQMCVQRIPREQSIAYRLACEGCDAVIVIEDSLIDERTKHHALSTGPDGLRFYAGVTICSPDGQPVGAFGVIDHKPRGALNSNQTDQLKRLGLMAADIISNLNTIRQSDERLETLKLVEQMSGVGHWRLEAATGAVEWSDEVYRIHGVERGVFEPRMSEAAHFYHPEDKVILLGMISRGLKTGEGYSAKMRILRADGEERQVLTQADTECDENGKVIALFGVFQDVTEQEKVLQQARRDESRYRLLAENVDDVITRVGLDGSSKYISPAIKNLLGWTLEDMSGQSTDYVHPEDRHLVLAAIGESVKAGAPTRLEHRAVHRDGSTVWVECTFKALKNSTGKVGDVIVVIRNITQRKALEAEVIEAKERAEKAAAAKSEFLANMSHELRTPLTSVIGFSGLLQESRTLPPEERRYVDLINTASGALLGVINDILDYSKLEANAIEMDPQPFEPVHLAEGAIGIVQPLYADKGLSLTLEIDPDLPDCLMGDEARLRQVLLNFLSNAAKFTARGGVTVTLTGCALEDGGWRLRMAVTDTGIGIPEAKAEQLFQRFTQADASTTRVYGGTGLGLAISRRLIELMDGEIGLDSQVGKGATFWVEAPMAIARPTAANAHDETSARSGEGLSGRILMADDAPANRELISTILRSLGLEIETVTNGAEAVQAVQQGVYDLVLMDVHMPVMDGLEATREIRRMQAVLAQGGVSRRTPILALTANVQADQIKRCLEAGMDGHLSKPVQIPALIASLSSKLAEAGAEPSERATAAV